MDQDIITPETIDATGVAMFVPCVVCNVSTRVHIPWSTLAIMIQGGALPGGKRTATGYLLGIRCANRGCARKRPYPVEFGQTELLAYQAQKPRGY